MMQEHRVLEIGSVHASFFRYNELPKYELDFRSAVARRWPGVPFTLEYRPHPNPLLNLEGDRLCVAVPLDG